MAKAPAFQFYPSDFLSDENVVVMTNQEVGCYIKLLCFCWKQGSIPKDLSKIAKLCGEDDTAMAQLWPSLKPCFIENGNTGRLTNPRLEKERKKQENYRKERSESGKKGAVKRWKQQKKNSSAIAKPMAEPMAKDSSSSSSSRKEPPIVPHKSKKLEADFERFWTAYPKKVGKGYCLDVWKNPKKRKKKKLPDIETILKAVERQKESEQWTKEGGRYIPNPATWLNQGRWDDELAETNNSGFKFR